MTTPMPPTVQRPMLSLRNDELSAVRHQLPTVYEALVQYDLLYLNAEARVEAKAQELQKSIDVGQEVLQQLRAVRQRCQELEDERDELEDERDDLDHKVRMMREQADQMKAILDKMHSGNLEATTEVEVLTNALQARETEVAALQSQLLALKDHSQREGTTISSVRDELAKHRMEAQDARREADTLKRDLQRLQSELQRLEGEQNNKDNELQRMEQDNAKLRAALEDNERARSIDAHRNSERVATEADIVSCGSIVAAMMETKSTPTTVGALREALQQLYQKFSDFRRRATTSDDERRMHEESLAELQRQFQNALEESQQSKKLVDRMREDGRALQQRLDNVLADTASKDAERQLQRQLEQRDKELLDAAAKLAEVRSLLKQKELVILQLERQEAERHAESRRAEAYADMESQLLEARQRAKMHEQTIGLLQSEIAALNGRLGIIPALEEELKILSNKHNKLEDERYTERKLRIDSEAKFAAKADSYEQLHSTLVAVQEELMEAQGVTDNLREELRKSNGECATLRNAAVPDVRGALRTAEAENTRLIDELAGLQKEVGKLQESLSRVARDDAAANAAVAQKLRQQENEVQGLREQVADLEGILEEQKRQLAQSLAQDKQNKEQLEISKQRMQDYLRSHVPELMFLELEQEFKKTKADLQASRQSALENEEAAAASKRKADDHQRRYDKQVAQLKQTSEFILEGLIEPLQAAEKYITDASSMNRRNLVVSATSLSPTPSRIHSSLHMSSPERLPLTSPQSKLNLSAFDQSTTSTAPMNRTTLQGVDKLGFALLEMCSSLRHRCLEAIRVLSSSSSSAGERSSNAEGSDPATSAELILRALHEATARAMQQVAGEKDSEMNEKIAQCQRETQAAFGQRDACKADLSALSASRQQLEAELSDLRQEWQTASQSRHVAVADVERERQARRALEASMDDERRNFASLQSDMQMERQSLMSKFDQLKEQLAAERMEHQTTVSNLFSELTVAKHEALQHQSGASERHAHDQRRLQSLEQELGTLRDELENAQREAEDSTAHITRLTNLLRDSKEEIKHVNGLLMSYQDADHHSQREASDRASTLQQRVAQLEVELREAQRRAESLNSSMYKQQMDERNAQSMDDRRALDSLYSKISILEEENRMLRMSQSADQQELEALLAANDLLEARLRDVEADRDPLRRKLHEVLAI